MDNDEIIGRLNEFAAEGSSSLEFGQHDRKAVKFLGGEVPDRANRVWYVIYYLKTKHGMQDDELGESHVRQVRSDNRADNIWGR